MSRGIHPQSNHFPQLSVCFYSVSIIQQLTRVCGLPSFRLDKSSNTNPGQNRNYYLSGRCFCFSLSFFFCFWRPMLFTPSINIFLIIWIVLCIEFSLNFFLFCLFDFSSCKFLFQFNLPINKIVALPLNNKHWYNCLFQALMGNKSYFCFLSLFAKVTA